MWQALSGLNPPSTPHLLSPKLGTMPWTCGPLGDTPDISGILLYSF